MTQIEKKKSSTLEDDNYNTGSHKGRKLSDAKRIRKVSPLGMRVVVQLRREADMTDGGLYLPEGSKQNLSESLIAQVVEVASAIDHHTDEEANISGVPLGSVVLIPKTAGVKVPWDDDLRIVETKEVLAIIHEEEII